MVGRGARLGHGTMRPWVSRVAHLVEVEVQDKNTGRGKERRFLRRRWGLKIPSHNHRTHNQANEPVRFLGLTWVVEAVSLGMEFMGLVYLVAVLLAPVVMEVVILLMLLLEGVLLAGMEVVPLMVKEVGMVDFLAVGLAHNNWPIFEGHELQLFHVVG